MARTPFKLRSGNTTPFKQMGSSPVKATYGDAVVQNPGKFESTKSDDPNIKKDTGRKTYKDAWGGMSEEQQKKHGSYEGFVKSAEDWWKSEAGQKRATTDPKFKHRVTKTETEVETPKVEKEVETKTTSKELRKKAGWTGDTPEGKKKMEEGAKKYSETKKKREKYGVFTSEGRAKIREKREKRRAERDAKRAAKKEAKRAAKEAKKPAWKKRKEKREAQNIAIYGEK